MHRLIFTAPVLFFLFSFLKQEIKADMIEELKKLRSKIKIGIVGGSDMAKQYEQLGKTGKTF